MQPHLKTTSELRPPDSVPNDSFYILLNLRKKTTSELTSRFDSVGLTERFHHKYPCFNVWTISIMFLHIWCLSNCGYEVDQKKSNILLVWVKSLALEVYQFARILLMSDNLQAVSYPFLTMQLTLSALFCWSDIGWLITPLFTRCPSHLPVLWAVSFCETRQGGNVPGMQLSQVGRILNLCIMTCRPRNLCDVWLNSCWSFDGPFGVYFGHR